MELVVVGNCQPQVFILAVMTLE